MAVVSLCCNGLDLESGEMLAMCSCCSAKPGPVVRCQRSAVVVVQGLDLASAKLIIVSRLFRIG
jgi:hypothetical protein